MSGSRDTALDALSVLNDTMEGLVRSFEVPPLISIIVRIIAPNEVHWHRDMTSFVISVCLAGARVDRGMSSISYDK